MAMIKAAIEGKLHADKAKTKPVKIAKQSKKIKQKNKLLKNYNIKRKK